MHAVGGPPCAGSLLAQGPYDFFISLGRISAPNERVKGARPPQLLAPRRRSSRDHVPEDLEVELSRIERVLDLLADRRPSRIFERTHERDNRLQRFRANIFRAIYATLRRLVKHFWELPGANKSDIFLFVLDYFLTILTDLS